MQLWPCLQEILPQPSSDHPLLRIDAQPIGCEPARHGHVLEASRVWRETQEECCTTVPAKSSLCRTVLYSTTFCISNKSSMQGNRLFSSDLNGSHPLHHSRVSLLAGVGLTGEQAECVERAVRGGREMVGGECQGLWCDALPCFVQHEWTASRKTITTSPSSSTNAAVWCWLHVSHPSALTISALLSSTRKSHETWICHSSIAAAAVIQAMQRLEDGAPPLPPPLTPGVVFSVATAISRLVLQAGLAILCDSTAHARHANSKADRCLVCC